MHSGKESSLADGGVPVFVIPIPLKYFADDPSTHKRVITLYNPSDYGLKYQILSTASKKYVVADAGGYVKSNFRIDIVIRHVDIQPYNYGVVDKFRILLFKKGSSKPCGKKDFTSALYPTQLPETAYDGVGDNDGYEQLASAPASVPAQPPQYRLPAKARDGGRGGGGGGGDKNVRLALYIFILGVCVAGLLLPTDGQSQDSFFPPNLHPTFGFKLMLSFFMGMIAMVILIQ